MVKQRTAKMDIAQILHTTVENFLTASRFPVIFTSTAYYLTGSKYKNHYYKKYVSKI
jgi:hypothetical protein